MRQQVNTFIVKHGFWLSLLCHLLLWSGFSFYWFNLPDLEKRPDLYIPSYIASSEQIAQSVPMQPAQPVQQPVAPTKPEQKKLTSENGIEKPAPKKPQPAAQKPVKAKAGQTSTASSYQAMSAASLEEQGVHLIGDEKIDKSLRTILGKAISRHLFYPKSAIEFNVRGTVLVGFTIYPDGRVTNVQLVKPSNAGILNVAALEAIRNMSPVEGVAEYIPEARFLVVGIIFG